MNFALPRTPGLLAGLLFGFAVTLRADDTLRHFEQSLHEQGFYYGPVDGNPGDELTQALRRYQIRNGLTVTGQLDDETRKSIDHTAQDLKKPGSAGNPGATPPPLATPGSEPPAPANRVLSRPKPAAPPLNSSSDADSDSGAEPPAAPRSPDTRPDLRVPPSQGPQIRPSAALTSFLEGTPYEFAPPPVQADVVRRAQSFLFHSGFYDGAVDGRPGQDIAEALQNFQGVNHLRKTGQLDTATLGVLRLLPDPRSMPARRYSSGNQPDGRGEVYEGRIVR